MAEFAARYGFVPDPDFAWPMFLALSRRLSQFDARELLDVVTGGMTGSAAGPFSSREARSGLKKMLADLEAVAYPGRAGKPRRGRTPINRDDDG